MSEAHDGSDREVFGDSPTLSIRYVKVPAAVVTVT
jgi:hypothetical protein